jgi:hypothetical protein
MPKAGLILNRLAYHAVGIGLRIDVASERAAGDAKAPLRQNHSEGFASTSPHLITKF